MMLKSTLMFDYASWTKRIPENIIRKLLKYKTRYYFAGGKPGILPTEIFARILVDLGVNQFQKLLNGKEREIVEEYNYGPTSGLDSFKEVLSKFLKEHDRLRVPPENIVITTGSQQSIYALLDSLIDPGDVVLSSNPTYLGFMNVAEKLQAKIVTLPTDEEGVVTDYLEKIYDETVKELGKKPEIIYVIPDSDNPTGTTLPLKRRKALFNFAAENNILVMEDAAYREIQFRKKIPPMKSFDEENKLVAYLRTSSKEAAPFRVAYNVIPEGLIKEVIKAKGYYDLCTTKILQKILEIYYSKYIDLVLPKTVKRYRERCEAMCKSLDESFPEGVRTDPKGGFFVWFRSAKKFNASKLLVEEAIPNDVAYVPGEAFFTTYGYFYNPDINKLERTKPRKNTMRLSFSYMTPEEIREGVKKLGTILTEKIDKYLT